MKYPLGSVGLAIKVGYGLVLFDRKKVNRFAVRERLGMSPSFTGIPLVRPVTPYSTISIFFNRKEAFIFWQMPFLRV